VIGAQEISDYVERGRRLKHTPEEALEGAWISLMRAQAAAPGPEYDTRLLDIEAEYSLRSINVSDTKSLTQIAFTPLMIWHQNSNSTFREN